MSRIAVLSCLVLTSCAAPWATARGVVTAADAALEALPDDLDGEEFAQATEALDAALTLGAQACDVWEREATRTAPTGWAKWVADALTAAASVAGIIKASGVDIPPLVLVVITTLQALLPALGGGA